MLDRLGSSIGSSFRSFEGYIDTLETLEGALSEPSKKAIIKHPDDIRATRENIIDRRIESSFGKYLGKLSEGPNSPLSPKHSFLGFKNPLPSFAQFAKHLILPLAIATTRAWLRFKISDRSVEKMIVRDDIETVFVKFSATLTEKIEGPNKTNHPKLSFPDLLDIQRAFKVKERFDRSISGELRASTKKALVDLSNAFEGQSGAQFLKGVDAHTAALIRDISHEILETAQSDRIPAYWGSASADRADNLQAKNTSDKLDNKNL